MKIQVSIYDSVPAVDRKPISRTQLTVPAEFDTVKSAEQFMIDSLYEIDSNAHSKFGFSHYAHVYLTDNDGEIISSVFPYGRTFFSLEEAETFFNDYSKYVSEKNS